MSDLSTLWRKVRRVIQHQGFSSADAEDIVQEAFARLESYTRIHELQSPEAFLVTTALNIGRDEARRRIRTPIEYGVSDTDQVCDSSPQPEEQAFWKERLRRAASGLEWMDEQTRRCVLSQRLDGMSCAQIAEAEGLSVAAVEKRVARAVLFLTQWMDEK